MGIQFKEPTWVIKYFEIPGAREAAIESEARIRALVDAKLAQKEVSVRAIEPDWVKAYFRDPKARLRAKLSEARIQRLVKDKLAKLIS